jgi:hypothetical protein
MKFLDEDVGRKNCHAEKGTLCIAFGHLAFGYISLFEDINPSRSTLLDNQAISGTVAVINIPI